MPQQYANPLAVIADGVHMLEGHNWSTWCLLLTCGDTCHIHMQAQTGQTSGTGYSQGTSPGQGRPTVAGHGQAVDYGISTGGTGIGSATGAPVSVYLQ